jgi:hypothetical protein
VQYKSNPALVLAGKIPYDITVVEINRKKGE